MSFRGPDDRLLRRELPPLRRGAARTARFELRPGERVAGLGEQASPVTLRGTTHRLWNRDPGGAWGPGDDPLYLCVPVLLGLHADGDVLAFFENPHEATVRVDGAAPVAADARVELTFCGGTDRHYVAAGTLPRLLERYSWLTGRPPLPPRWSLGFHQCRWGYRTQGEVREVADGFAREGLPLSAVHLDIDHMDGYRVFTADPVRFGDLEGLCGDLAARGTRVVTIVDPAVKADESFEVFRQGRDDGRFLPDADGRPLLGVVWPGRAAFPDFTDPATREWWAGLYKGLLDAGVSGVWHDMNEPTSIALWGDRTLPPGTRHVAEGRGGDHRQCHNVYGLLMDRAGFEAQAAGRPDRRPWLLSRSGWAGLAALGLVLDGRRRGDLGGAPPAGRHRDRPGALGHRLHRVRHRRVQRRPRPRAVPALAGAGGPHAVLPHPLGDRGPAPRALAVARALPHRRRPAGPLPLPPPPLPLHPGPRGQPHRPPLRAPAVLARRAGPGPRRGRRPAVVVRRRLPPG